jgi:glutathione S-transferase
MIKLYRPVHSPVADDIEAALKELVLAHKVIVVEPDQRPPVIPADTSLPILEDEGQRLSEPAAIAQHLKTLEEIVTQWRKYQGDSCYSDEESGSGFC